MNDREFTWYEGKHGEHPATCNCASCQEARRAKQEEGERTRQEQAEMRLGAEWRLAWTKKMRGRPTEDEARQASEYAQASEARETIPATEDGRHAGDQPPTQGRVWWGDEYYDSRKRRWRRPTRSPRWVVKLCLNLVILTGLLFLVRLGYHVFAYQTGPVRDCVILTLGIVAWVLVIKLSRSRGYRWVGPSFKLTAALAISVLLVLGFAGVQPLATHKDALVEGLTSAANTIRSAVPTAVSPLGISYTEADVEELIIVLVNEERQRFALPALSQDPLLTSLAREHSISMVENDFFSHDRHATQRSFSYNQPAGTIRGENLSKTPIRRLIPGPYLSSARSV